MITVTPQGQIYICKTPLENDYKNQLTFTNKENQLNYFNSTIQHSFSDYTYVKKDNIVNVGINIDKIIDCNYLFYRNNGFLDDENNVRIFYCFITGMRYVNENCTEIAFETDCFQTWQFDINYKKCFVEREHVNDDTIGSHTIPEGLELGEYICVKDKTSVLDNPSDFYICMAVTELPDESTPPYSNHRVYNGIFGSVNEKITNEKIEIIVINAIFGGVELDLRNLNLTHDLKIEICSIFGGVDLFLNDDYNIIISSTSIFGGVENKHNNKKDKGNNINISSINIFGGTDLK
jgi:hypothetical protein